MKTTIAIDHLLDLIATAPLHEAGSILSLSTAVENLYSVERDRSKQFTQKALDEPTACGEAGEPETTVKECGAVATGFENTAGEPEKPKRTRRTKAEIEAAAAVLKAEVSDCLPPVEGLAESTEDPAGVDYAAVQEASAEPTLQEHTVTRQSIRDYFQANRTPEVKAKLATLLAEYKSASVTDIPEDKVTEFYGKLTA